MTEVWKILIYQGFGSKTKQRTEVSPQYSDKDIRGEKKRYINKICIKPSRKKLPNVSRTILRMYFNICY